MLSRSNARILVALAAVVGLSAAAGPALAEDEAEGRRRFKRGQELYNDGRFLDAAREFEAGYAAAPRPLFLLNIGHSYRRAQDFKKAKSAYETLLRTDPTTTYRAEVESLIKSIDDALQTAEPARPAAKPEPPPPAPTPVVVANNPPPSSETPPVFVSAPAAPMSKDDGESESVFKKPWFWAVVGGVAVAAGVGIAVISLRKESCPGTICISERDP